MFCAFATPALAQQNGLTACSVETVNQKDGVVTFDGVTGGCKNTTVKSVGQTGGVTAGSIGTVNQTSKPPAAAKSESRLIPRCLAGDTLRINFARSRVLLLEGGRDCKPGEKPSIMIDLGPDVDAVILGRR